MIAVAKKFGKDAGQMMNSDVKQAKVSACFSAPDILHGSLRYGYLEKKTYGQ